MELVKNIFFNTDKLVENSKVKILILESYLKKIAKTFTFTMAMELTGIIFQT